MPELWVSRMQTEYEKNFSDMLAALNAHRFSKIVQGENVLEEGFVRAVLPNFFLRLKVDSGDLERDYEMMKSDLEKAPEVVIRIIWGIDQKGIGKFARERAKLVFERNTLLLRIAARLYRNDFGTCSTKSSDLIGRYLPPEVMENPFGPEPLTETSLADGFSLTVPKMFLEGEDLLKSGELGRVKIGPAFDSPK